MADSKKLIQTINLFIPTLALILILLSLSVMIGWILNISTMVQIQPTWVPMQFNTALCFLLSGLSLFGVKKNDSPLFITIIITLLAISLLTLSQYIFSYNLGLDELLIKHSITTETSHPGRMAPNTAFCFILTAFVFILNRKQDYKNNPKWIGMTSSVIAILGVVSLVGYISEIETAYVWSRYTSMAVHTSIGFILIGIGLIFHTLSQTESKNYHWIAWALMTGCLVFTISMWSAFERQEDNRIRDFIEAQSTAINNDIKDRFYLLLAAHERLANRWVEDEGTPKSQFDSDAGNYTSDHSAFAAYKWVDSNYNVKWIVPEISRKDYINLDYAQLKNRFINLNKAKKQKKTVVSNFLKFNNNTYGFHITTPLFLKKGFDGFITAVFSIDKFMNTLLQKHPELINYSFKLYAKRVLIYDWGHEQPTHSDFIFKGHFDILENNWNYTLAPSQKAISALKSNVPEIILFFGILVSLALFTLTKLYFVSLNRKSELQFLNENLEAKIQERTQKLQTAKNSAINMMLDAEDAKQQIEQYALELKDSQEELQEKNVELEQFAYVASHDLQEPLRKIISFSSILEKNLADSLSGDSKRHFQYISDASLRMRDLIQALLNLSRLGRKEVIKEPVSIQEIIDGLVDLFSISIEETHAKIVYKDLPTVNCSRDFIAQVFQNLIGNAIKFHLEGKAPVIEITAHKKEDHWLFEVKDNGIGIDKAYVDKVFEIFQRLHKRQEYQGTGIGLAICKKIIERHDGEIWVESTPGEGSTFFFTLPFE